VRAACCVWAGMRRASISLPRRRAALRCICAGHPPTRRAPRHVRAAAPAAPPWASGCLPLCRTLPACLPLGLGGASGVHGAEAPARRKQAGASTHASAGRTAAARGPECGRTDGAPVPPRRPALSSAVRCRWPPAAPRSGARRCSSPSAGGTAAVCARAAPYSAEREKARGRCAAATRDEPSPRAAPALAPLLHAAASLRLAAAAAGRAAGAGAGLCRCGAVCRLRGSGAGASLHSAACAPEASCAPLWRRLGCARGMLPPASAGVLSRRRARTHTALARRSTSGPAPAEQCRGRQAWIRRSLFERSRVYLIRTLRIHGGGVQRRPAKLGPLCRRRAPAAGRAARLHLHLSLSVRAPAPGNAPLAAHRPASVSVRSAHSMTSPWAQ
jgi:hypothetical protein